MRGQWVITLTLVFFGFAPHFHRNYLAESLKEYFIVGPRYYPRYARLAAKDKATIDELARECVSRSGRPASFRSEQDEKNIAAVAADSGLPALLTGIERSYEDPNMFVDAEGNKMDPKGWLVEPTYNVNEICVEYVVSSIGFKWRTTDCHGYGMICETVRKEFVEISDTTPQGFDFWYERCQKLGGQLAKIMNIRELRAAASVGNKDDVYMTGVFLKWYLLGLRTIDDESPDYELIGKHSNTPRSERQYRVNPKEVEIYSIFALDGRDALFRLQLFNFTTTVALCEVIKFS